MQRAATHWRAATAWLTIFMLSVNPLAPSLSFAQSSGKAAPGASVRKGQEYYEQSRFDEAISLLKDLVDRGTLSGDDLQKARELLARSYVKKGHPEQGKEMFKTILRDDPNWRTDPVRVPPDENAVFDAALKEFQGETVPAPGTAAPQAPAQPTPVSPEPGEATRVAKSEKKPLLKQWWVWLLGAAVVGGTAAALAGGGSDGPPPPPPPQSLPNFPSTP